jgi:peptide/nickel transport system permease protein
MMRFLLRRFGTLLLTLLLTSVLIFAITQLLPGDVARIILGRDASEAAVENLRSQLGLDASASVQYLRWLGDFVRGEWGTSFSSKDSVMPIVLGRTRNSLMLAALTLAVSVPLAIALGVAAGLREDSLFDNLFSISALSVVGLPEFVTGLVLIELFAFRLGILPANATIRPGEGFFEALPMMILPAATATLVLLAYIARLTRAQVIEEIKKPYLRTARLKGLPGHTILIKHMLRNALLPSITVIAISFGWLISGLIVIENVFNFPGLGRLLVFALERRDIPIIQAVSMVTVLGFAAGNLAADLLYAILNPRIELE